MQKGRELKAQLYIEGRSVPFLGATIQANVGHPTTCNISLVPLYEINDILPRTMIHLFVKDFTSVRKPWVLAFEGEVYGYSMGKSVSERSFSISCMDLSSYWDNAKQFYMNQRTSFADEISIFTSSAAAGAAKKENSKVQITTSGISAYMVNLVNNKIKAGKNIIEAILEIIKGIEEVNPFFRYANARYRLNERIIFKDAGNIDEIFDFSNSSNLFQMMSGRGNGGTRTIRQIILELMSLIFHEFVSCPFPSKTGSISSGIGKNNKQTIGSFIFKPMNFMLPPPKCNVLFPDHYGRFSFNRTFFHEVTRTKTSARLTASERVLNKHQVFNQFYYAPSGFNTYRTGEKGEVEGKQYENAGVSGKHGDEAKTVIKNSTTLGDFNFLSYEEVLKGIFSDQDNVMPSAQILSKIKSYGGQTKFFQRAADFLFFKKRLASRQASASGGLNLAPVPGFTMLLIDNSAAEQHVLGTLMGLVHTINPQSGGMTSYTLGYARYVEEKDLWEESAAEPPIPPWYDPEIFGKRRAITPADYAKNKSNSIKKRIKKLKYINDFGNSKIDSHYKALLGRTKSGSHLGAESITSKNFSSVVAATLEIVRLYQTKKDPSTILRFISSQTRRDYVELTEVFQFLGATIPKYQKNASRQDNANVIFKGKVFDGEFTGKVSDKENAKDRELKTIFGVDVTKKRREFLKVYRKRLFTERGFRG